MASKTIKGLTVEIGGDTTKLGKALEDVEKKSRSLTSELREIEKGLKFNPDDITLLAQKQKVLAETVEVTAKKLDTLKEAEKQVQVQFARGEASEEQVRALQREIIETASKMDHYQSEAKKAAEAIEKLGDGSDKAQKGMDETGNEAKTAAKKVDDFSDSADKAEKSGGNMGKTLGSVAVKGFAAVAAAAAAAITGLVGAAESTREYRTAMGKLDTAFTQNGHTAEAAKATYEGLQGILGDTDQAVEAANHLAKLTDSEKDLATWSGDILPGVFATFGDSLPIEGLTEAANETAKVGQVTGPLADALNWAGVSEDAFNESLAKCSSEQERQALITETLAGLYGEASKAYQETNAEVIRANQANEQWMQSMAGVGGAIEPIITDVKMMGASLLSDLIPGVEQLATSFRSLLSGDAGGAAGVGEALSGIITQLLDKIVSIAPAVAQAAVSLVTSLVTTLVSMLPQVLSTAVQLVTTILDGLTTALPQIITAVADMIPRLVAAIVAGVPQLLQGAVQLLLAILDAIPQILPPLVAALPQIVMALVNGLLQAIPQLLTGAVQFLCAIVDAIPQLIATLVPQIPQIVLTIIDGLMSLVPQLIQGALQLLMAIVDAIPLLIETLVPQIPQIVMAITSKIGEMAPVILQAAIELLWGIIKAIPEIVVAIGQNFPQILQAMLAGLNSMNLLIWNVLKNVVLWVVDWIVELAGKAKELGPKFIAALQNFFKDLPYKVGYMLGQVIAKVATWAVNMATKAKEAGSKFITNAVNFIKNLPSKIWNFLVQAVTKVATWGTNMRTKAKEGMQKVVSTVTDTLKSLPSKVVSIGKDLVTGLWNGVNDKFTWLKNKIKSFTSGVLDGIKDFFGVHSPSTETAWIGDMLDQGLAEGMLDNMRDPVKAAQAVAGGTLDAMSGVGGLAVERSLQGRTAAVQAATAAPTGIAEKLDKILSAIERGQVLAIDGKQLVGATAAQFDNALGQRRVLAARGAL